MPDILLSSESVYSAAKTCGVFQAAFRFPDLVNEIKIASFSFVISAISQMCAPSRILIICPSGSMKRSIQVVGSPYWNNLNSHCQRRQTMAFNLEVNVLLSGSTQMVKFSFIIFLCYIST